MWERVPKWGISSLSHQRLPWQKIFHLYRDYFEQSGETLLKYTDKFTESMHSQLRQFEESHHYKNLKFECETHAEAQHKSIVHLNSLNID